MPATTLIDDFIPSSVMPARVHRSWLQTLRFRPNRLTILLCFQKTAEIAPAWIQSILFCRTTKKKGPNRESAEMSRHYLFPEGGDPLRLSQRLVEGLVFGKDALPQFASTKQRVLSAMLELNEGKPIRIVRTEASIWQFDKDGGIREGLHHALALAMDSVPTPKSDDTVVELRPHAKHAKLQKEYRWEPGAAEIERIIADIWPKKKSDRLKAAEGVARRKPPLTFDAREAINEVSGLFWKISSAIEGLKEPSQKAFAFEARERANADPEYAHLYSAIAEMSDWHLQVQRRRRTGKGVWYALVDITMWDSERVGHSLAHFHEKCAGRDAAVTAARKLLREHSDQFADNITVEAEVLTDLEWEVRAQQIGVPDDAEDGSDK